jgi:hypothetical protein
MYDSLLANLYDVLRLESLIAGATLGVEELQKFLQRFGIRGVPQKRSFPLHQYQVFCPELVEMMR